MSTRKQIEANQQNSQLSSGPKTSRGKTKSSKNAVKHGLLSSETFFSWESSSKLEVLKQNILNSLQPVGEFEHLLVDRIISLTWRLRRAGRIETGIFSLERYAINRQIINDEVMSILKNRNFTNEIKCSDSELNEIKQALIIKALATQCDMPDLGLIFAENTNSLTNLHRYEANIERSLFKTLHELQRLQAVRMGAEVPLPVAIDLTGDIEKPAL